MIGASAYPHPNEAKTVLTYEALRLVGHREGHMCRACPWRSLRASTRIVAIIVGFDV